LQPMHWIRNAWLHIPVRVDSGRTLFARTCLRLLQATDRSSQSAARVGQWPAAQVLPLCAGLPGRHSPGHGPGERPVEVFNLGTDEFCKVNDSIGWITGQLGLRPALAYAGGERGWIATVHSFFSTAARSESWAGRRGSPSSKVSSAPCSFCKTTLGSGAKLAMRLHGRQALVTGGTRGWGWRSPGSSGARALT